MGERAAKKQEQREADAALDEQLRGVLIEFGGQKFTFNPDTASSAQRCMVRMAFRREAQKVPEA